MTATSSPNDYEDFIKDLLLKEYGRETLSIDPIRHHNARVYGITVSEAGPNPPNTRAQPGVLPLPPDTTKLIVRFSDPASMLNEDIRVQNEVAVMTLARQALKPLDESLVPLVYGWSPFSEGKGWTLMEFKQGVPLGDKFPSLDADGKRVILQQIARIFKCIQSFELPGSIKTYGGLNFAEDGTIVSGKTPIAGGGPCGTLTELYAEYFQTQMAFADRCDIVKGWKDSDMRVRLDRFGAERLKDLVGQVDARLTLVHGDFDGNNVLFDEATNKITALLDYDFGHIGSQADEYFYSFPSIHGLLIPPFIPDPDEEHLRECLLQGFSSEDAKRKSQSHDWATAFVKDEEFGKAGVERPVAIKGIDQLSSVFWFIQNISPPMFFLERWRAKATSDRIAMIMGMTRDSLERNLEHWGL
ncbi:hypothetical protein CPLU01_13898 [Colletotrichum plurivorum]|uniref:Aminoglycoside phosphotransferase domain-containing protein n=1 Tax=Colletotrichum plurivorum TaxID=2175906 RepID=A0A8H6N0Z0_9PEZI|nr:hypothetical protein CPLU01_13898 [Colletotrichum plurivorum]